MPSMPGCFFQSGTSAWLAGSARFSRPITANLSGCRRAASSARSLRSPSHDGGTRTMPLTFASSISKSSISRVTGYGFCASTPRLAGPGRSRDSAPRRCTWESTMNISAPFGRTLLAARHVDRQTRDEVGVAGGEEADDARLIDRLRDAAQRHALDLGLLLDRRHAVPARAQPR